MSSDLVPRHAESLVAEALAQTRVVLVNGVRQSGKSTLTRLTTAGRPGTVTRLLDDTVTLRAAQDDPTSFVEHDGLMVIDEIQLALEVLRAIKASVEAHRESWHCEAFPTRCPDGWKSSSYGRSRRARWPEDQTGSSTPRSGTALPSTTRPTSAAVTTWTEPSPVGSPKRYAAQHAAGRPSSIPISPSSSSVTYSNSPASNGTATCTAFAGARYGYATSRILPVSRNIPRPARWPVGHRGGVVSAVTTERSAEWHVRLQALKTPVMQPIASALALGGAHIRSAQLTTDSSQVSVRLGMALESRCLVRSTARQPERRVQVPQYIRCITNCAWMSFHESLSLNDNSRAQASEALESGTIHRISSISTSDL
jgi:hypothetical protein